MEKFYKSMLIKLKIKTSLKMHKNTTVNLANFWRTRLTIVIAPYNDRDLLYSYSNAYSNRIRIRKIISYVILFYLFEINRKFRNRIRFAYEYEYE